MVVADEMHRQAGTSAYTRPGRRRHTISEHARGDVLPLSRRSQSFNFVFLGLSLGLGLGAPLAFCAGIFYGLSHAKRLVKTTNHPRQPNLLTVRPQARCTSCTPISKHMKQTIEGRLELAKASVHGNTASMWPRAAVGVLSRWSGCCNFSTATQRAGRCLGLIGESANPRLLLSLLSLRVVCPAWIFLREVRYHAPLPFPAGLRRGRQGCRPQFSTECTRVCTHHSRHRDRRSTSGGCSWVARCSGVSPPSIALRSTCSRFALKRSIIASVRSYVLQR